MSKPAEPLTLDLIRHGETAWSRLGRHTGLTDLALSPVGEHEARALAQRMAELPFSQVLSSPSQRARRTCELAGLQQGLTLDSDLSEWDYGDYEGQRSVDIQQKRPGWNLFRDGCPNGETSKQVSDRADRVITRMRKLQGRVAIFSHGQFLCVLAARWIGLPTIEAQHLQLHTASHSTLGFDSHHPEIRVISLWNGRPQHHA